ncbi:Omp28-related outer membrane protein [Myroides sp. BIT-d1]|uniref:Omp28-related outer membrane protein n=1 Tax=Myroides albus TaxID=2562892 RepID=A0A6I3LU42_9FLAO|nr:Omp28-related outer membrane protein [Myroides albus]MTG99452.1 Omp28-related outer membrane protein [Myroides albus]
MTKTAGEVKVSLQFTNDINEELKYVVYLIEDDLKYKQANSTPLYGNNTGKGRWENNFMHQHVLRAANNFAGIKVAANETIKAKEFKTTVALENYTLDNLEKTSVVVVILDKNGKALNAQIAKANTTQDYEIVK